MSAKQTPVIVKHCALAIYRSGYCSGDKIQRVQQALEIAVSRLIEYGFIYKVSRQAAPEKIKLRNKGKMAEASHRREPNAKKKTDEWNALYRLIQEEVEEEEDSGAMTETVTVDPPHTDTDKQQQWRRAKASRSSSKLAAKRTKRATRAKPKKAPKARRR